MMTMMMWLLMLLMMTIKFVCVSVNSFILGWRGGMLHMHV